MVRYPWIALFFFISTLHAGEGLKQIFEEGKLLLNARYRLEWVDSAPNPDDALASTLRTRLGFETGALHGWTALVEFENLTVIGDAAYNDTANGRTNRPVIADREDTELNRAQLTYTGLPNGELVVGRQRIILANHRFVGNVGWRQNEQTFDALRWNAGIGKKIDLSLAYLDNANRIFGEGHPNPASADHRLESFLAHGEVKDLPVGTLTLFGYFFGNKTLPATAHKDFGARLHGSWQAGGNVRLAHDLAYADQSSYRDGADTIDATYYSVSWGPQWGDWSFSLSQEVLGGDGVYGFATPYATLHAHNGWADIFLATPAAGLQDRFLTVAYGKKGWKFTAVYHHFQSDEGSVDYGEEWDAHLTGKVGTHLLLGLKLADYSADNFAADTTKIWAYADFSW